MHNCERDRFQIQHFKPSLKPSDITGSSTFSIRKLVLKKGAVKYIVDLNENENQSKYDKINDMNLGLVDVVLFNILIRVYALLISGLRIKLLITLLE